MRILITVIGMGCLISGSFVFGQDLSYYSNLGKLTRQTPGAIRTDGLSILIYKNQGLLFHLSSPTGPVESAGVFQPRAPVRQPFVSGPEVVVPGVSTCGIALRASRQQVNASPLVMGAKRRVERTDGTAVFCELQDGRTLLVFYVGDRVTQVEINGRFATGEGITEKSTQAQIQQVYGLPDQQFGFEFRIAPWLFAVGMFATVLVMPAFGFVTGLSVRMRRRRLASSGAGGLLSLALLGAAGMAAAYLISCLGVSLATGQTNMIWSRAAGGALAGASGILVMEWVCPSLAGRRPRILTLAAMVFVAHIATMLVGALTTGDHDLPSMSLWLTTVPFMTTLLVGSGRQPEK